MDLRASFLAIKETAEQFFSDAADFLRENLPPAGTHIASDVDHWSLLPDQLKRRSENIEAELLDLGAQIAQVTTVALMATAADTAAVRTAVRKLVALLKMRRLIIRDAQAIYKEGEAIGLLPPSQAMSSSIAPREAQTTFVDVSKQLLSSISLIRGLKAHQLQPGTAGQVRMAPPIRPGTAFLMMWMDKDQSDLLDVLDLVKATFLRFNIVAVRADDIEYDGSITQRTLDEIQTAEFLFADLTGVRPNVYYEVGYAHALKKRVILFRKRGTGLHFDLADHNCPEYSNLRDLKEKLVRRLTDMTNTNPNPD